MYRKKWATRHQSRLARILVRLLTLVDVLVSLPACKEKQRSCSHGRETQYATVQLAIGVGTGGPARVVRHRTCDETGPAIALRVVLQCTAQCIEQGRGRV